jgi:hypothetical protein
MTRDSVRQLNITGCFCCYRGIIGRRFQAKARFLQELLEKIATLLSGTPIVRSRTLPTSG